MDLIEIYLIGSQAAQTRFACADQVVPRSADIVFAGPHSEKRFCGNQNSIAPSLKRFPENILRLPFRVGVSRIKYRSRSHHAVRPRAHPLTRHPRQSGRQVSIHKPVAMQLKTLAPAAFTDASVSQMHDRKSASDP